MRPTPLPTDLAGRAFTLAEASARHVTRDRLLGRDLHRPTRGVRVAGKPETVLDAARAVALVLPEAAAFSHRTAAHLLGLCLPEDWIPGDRLDVIVPTRRPPVRRAGVTAHRGLERRRVVARHGLQVVAAEATWCDLADDLLLDDLIVLGDSVIHVRQPVTLEMLTTEVTRRVGLRGSRTMRAALPELRDRSASAMETRTRLLFLREGLPEPELNATVLDDVGQWLSESDFVWRRQRVIVEYDGDHHRTDKRQWRADKRRLQLLADAGWCVSSLTADDVVRRPQETVARIARLLRWRRSPAPRRPGRNRA